MNVRKKERPQDPELFGTSFDFGLVGSIKEIMLLIGAYEHLTSKIQNLEGNRRHPTYECSTQFSDIVGSSRTVIVVLFGIFRLDEICMPSNIEETGRALLIARPVQQRPHEDELDADSVEAFSKIVDIQHVINELSCASRRPNFHDGFPVPPPMYQFFVFAARRYLGLRFQPGFFERVKDSGYLEQIQWGYVFKETDWDTFPFREYDPSPVLKYERPS
jgi:hypothetical protein